MPFIPIPSIDRLFENPVSVVVNPFLCSLCVSPKRPHWKMPSVRCNPPLIASFSSLHRLYALLFDTYIIMAAPCDDFNWLTGFFPAWAIQCYDLLNPPPGQNPGQRWAQKPCGCCSGRVPPQVTNVCGGCYETMRMNLDQMYLQMVSLAPTGQPSGAPLLAPGPVVNAPGTIATPPWPPLPPPGGVRFPEFWTRLCVPWYV